MSLGPRIAVTGLNWMGGGVGSIESFLEKSFKEVEDDIIISAYAITNGADVFLDWVEMVLGRGVKVSILINHFDGQSKVVAKRLLKMLRLYSHFYIYNFCPPDQRDLHAKVIVFDRNRALVGSSNLSRRGLENNLELGIIVEGKIAAGLADVVERVMGGKDVRLLSVSDGKS